MRLRKIFLRVAVGVMVLVLCAGAAVYFLLKPRTYEWRDTTSSDNQFRVSLPSNPSLLDTNEKSKDGLPFTSHTLKSSPRDRVFYVVSWWENPVQGNLTTDELFEHFRQCGIKVFRPGFVREHNVNVHGHPAKFVFIVTGNFFVENLVLRAGNRVYSLTVMDPRVVQERENIWKFFGSFKLLQ